MNSEAFNRFLAFLKAIRMGWLIPFFLLARGEDPKAQGKAIVGGVVVPLVAILVFLFVWSAASKRIVTKFGTVPGPRQVLSAWESLMNEIRLEEIKENDHVRRSRERRMEYLTRYQSVLADMDPEIPDFGDMEKNKEALTEMELAFEEVNEVLEVSNKVSVAPDVETAVDIAQSFRFERSRNVAERVINKLLPLELDYKASVESFNLSTVNDPAPGDAEDMAKRNEILKEKEERKLAKKKAGLMIQRQKISSMATRTALETLDNVSSSTRSRLQKFDHAASLLAPLLQSRLQFAEAEETRTGEKFRDMAKLKIMAKNFEDKPYPGRDTYIQQIMTSLKTVFAGFCIASIIAIPVGVLCGLNKNINNAINPLIQIFKPVSPLAWLPIVMIVVGALYVSDDPMFEISFINSAITVALCSLWPTLVNTAVGVASTDKDFLNVARVLKLSWTKKIFKVVLPSSLPMVFTGLRLSLGVGWMVLIAAEMLAQNPGLGKFVWDMFQNGSSETLSMILVAVFTIGIIGFILDTIMLSLQQMVSFGDAV